MTILIHLFKYLLSDIYVPDIILDAWKYQWAQQIHTKICT